MVRPLNLVSSREAEMRVIHSVDGVPRSYRDRKDFALQGAQILKARNPKVATEMLDAYSGAMPLRGRPSRGCEAVN